jgi:AraC-like DNA-binding protein
MLNFVEAVRSNPGFNKLEIGNLLFAQYTCPVETSRLAQWAQTDYLIHVLSGRKTWHMGDGSWTARAGDTLFFKKGASIIEQFFGEDFCLLLFFIPDALIRSIVRELGDSSESNAPVAPIPSLVRVENDIALTAFFQSMRAYFSAGEKPSEPLLQLKVKELIVSILTGRSNRSLAAYFQSIARCEAPSVREIMEANFRFNLSLEEFAKLCHRSLSTFKRDFRNHFNESPGKWLLRRRLDYAAKLLQRKRTQITEVVFESGFEDVSHFSRVFKARFNVSPSAYRQPAAAAN